MSDFENNSGGFVKRDGTGALFTNKKMTSERSPVMTGYVIYKGEEIRIAGWSKITSTGDKMLNLTAEPAGQYQGDGNGTSQGNVNNNSNFGGQSNGNQGTSGTSGGTGESIDDAIPF